MDNNKIPRGNLITHIGAEPRVPNVMTILRQDVTRCANILWQYTTVYDNIWKYPIWRRDTCAIQTLRLFLKTDVG